MRGIEGDHVELECQARGSPPPRYSIPYPPQIFERDQLYDKHSRYTWLNWKGEDATKTEGKLKVDTTLYTLIKKRSFLQFSNHEAFQI